MHVVYALQDPRNNEVFYVGETHNLYTRFVEHIRCRDNNTRKNERISELKAVGLLPIPLTLEVVRDDQGLETEKYWIAHYHHLGMPLCNSQHETKVSERTKHTHRVQVIHPSVVMIDNLDEKRREVERLRALNFRQGEILQRIWDVKPGANRDYQDALKEYKQITEMIVRGA